MMIDLDHLCAFRRGQRLALLRAAIAAWVKDRRRLLRLLEALRRA